MTTSLSSQLRLTLGWQFQNSLDLSTVADNGSIQLDDDLENGSGLDQANLIWHDQRTLAAAAHDDLDLAGTLTDAFGQTVTFTKLKGLLLHNRATTAGEILHVGGGSNPIVDWIGAGGDLVKVGPAGILLLWNPSLAGYTVTASTADVLRITNAGIGSIDYDILLLGVSA